MALACLATLSPYDIASNARFEVNVSSINDMVAARKVNGLNGKVWEPALAEPPVIGLALWNGDFQAAVAPGGASLPIMMNVARLTYPLIDAAMWIGAPVTIYAAEPGTAWPWPTLFVGRVTGYSRKGQRLTLSTDVDSEPLKANVLTATYAGTGGAEGGADLKNRLKPLALGWALSVEPVLIDAVNNVYQFSGYGAIEGVTTLFERGSDFGAATADFATYAALVAAVVPAGRWASCLATGMIRLGAPAFGVITGDIKGHKVGGTTPRLTGAVIQALATIAGVSAGNIDSPSLTALDAAVAYSINLVLIEQSSFFEIAQALALGCNYQAGTNLVGKFFVIAITLAPTEALTLNARGRASPQVIESEELDVSVPYWRTVLGANRAWRAHSADEIAYGASLVERGLYAAAQTYRDGNVVNLIDGSRWLYIFATPTTGNAPPTWPTTSNTWWSALTGPTNTDFANVIGGTKPANYATSGENIILNPGLAGGTSSWNLTGGGLTWTAAAAGDPGNFFRATAHNQYAYANEPSGTASPIPLPSGTKSFSVSAYVRSDNTANKYRIGFDWYNAAGSYTGSEASLYVVATGGSTWTLGKLTITPPAGTVAGRAYIQAVFAGGTYTDLNGLRISGTEADATVGAVAGTNLKDSSGTVLADAAIKNSAVTLTSAGALSGAGGGSITALDFANTSGATKPENSADVTQIIVAGPDSTFLYDYDGTAKSGQFARDIVFKLFRGTGTDVTTSATWSAASISGAATYTIGAATGVLNVTALTSETIVEVSSAYLGITRKFRHKLRKLLDAPPNTGSGGGTSVSTSTITSTTASTYTGGGNIPMLTVKTGSAATITFSFPATFTRATNGVALSSYGKWQWRVVGGTYADVATEIVSSVGASKAAGIDDPGSLEVAMSKSTGLSANTNYEVMLFLRGTSTVQLDFTGTAIATGS